MITIPTDKCRKSSFKHSKTIYVFTSRPGIVTVQIHSKKEKGTKLKTQPYHKPFALPCVNMTKKSSEPTNVNVAVQGHVQTPMLDVIVNSLVGTMLNKILSFFLKARDNA
jgi:hypothetical protein